MKIVQKLMVLALAAVAMIAWIQVSDPTQALKEINEARAKTLNDARQSGKAIDAAALQKETVEKAKAAVKGVDPAKIDAKQGLAWAQLFAMAELHKEACDSAAKYLTTNLTAEEKFRAQTLMMRSCNALGEGHMLVMMIGEVSPPDSMSGLSFVRTVAGIYADTINQKMGVDQALKSIGLAEVHMPTADKVAEKDKPLYYASVGMIATSKSELLADAGRKTEALAALDKGISLLPVTDPNVRSLKAGKLRMTMMHSAAPTIAVERKYGEFAGLEALKGKVVLLDFFAHWCGPCIRAFPDMIKMYEELKPQGLEIVGVTTYYGYYKRENTEKRDMARDIEFGKMGEFIAEHKLPWPVVYGERANFEAYGITGIPHVTVLDRKGNVVKIKIGYSPESFAKFREELEKLMAEK